MVLPGLFPGGGQNTVFVVIQTIISLLFIVMIFFFPKIMIWQTDRKLKNILVQLDAFRNDAKTMFLENYVNDMDQQLERKFESLRDFKFSAPTSIDPAGMVGKLELVLDSSEDKFERFIRKGKVEDEEELANLNMAFKGVMGTHQIYKVLRHFRKLIKKTQNIQLVGLIQMMLPVYKELAESQKEATRAFVDGAPIGDAIGPMVAAKFITEEPEEIAEDIVHSEEDISGQKVHVLKSRGPGARLGKYGDALEKVADEKDIEAIVTVDAGAKFEGEETGSISEGVGVMMGGPGVEKSKIEEVASEKEIPLEGVIIKQSPPEASKPMKKEIFEAYKPAIEKVEELVEEIDGEIAVVGVGNTCGIANQRENVKDVSDKLEKYWEEYEEEEEDDVSYMGMMGAFPGGDSSSIEDHADLFWKIPRF